MLFSRYFWGPTGVVRVHKKTGVAERKYAEFKPRKNGDLVKVGSFWRVVDGVTLAPRGVCRTVPSEDRRMTAQRGF